MGNIKSLKEIVTKNCKTVNEIIDYAESFEKEFESRTKSAMPLPAFEKLSIAVRLSEIAKTMDSCEKIIKSTIQAILIADLEVEGDDISQCLELYTSTANHYEVFKEAAYKTILDEDYLKTVFKENN